MCVSLCVCVVQGPWSGGVNEEEEEEEDIEWEVAEETDWEG